MPRVIRFPPADPCPSTDEARFAQAWTAFAADDAKASAPAGLEARVILAAQAALSDQRRSEVERHRHHWLAGLSALAASLLAASAWWLGGGQTEAPVTPPAAAVVETANAVAVSVSAPAPGGRRASAPVPMTNVEAGRVIDGSPLMLAARPLLDAADNGLVRAAIVPRAKSFLAPVVVAAPIPLRASNTPAGSAQPEERAASPGPLGVAPPAGTATAPDVWTSRGFQGVFDPTSAQHPPTPPAPKEEPPPPPPN